MNGTAEGGAPVPIAVRLTWPELWTGAIAGLLRQIQNLRNGRDRRPAYGAPGDDSWTFHIEGACGEKAVAKHLGIYWCSGSAGADDVGRYQVRTAADHARRLLIHRPDRDDRAFVLVTGRAPAYQIRGWMMARDAKRGDWWGDPGEDRGRPTGRLCYMVPTDHLWAMEHLP